MNAVSPVPLAPDIGRPSQHAANEPMPSRGGLSALLLATDAVRPGTSVLDGNCSTPAMPAC